jgi:hypothetical protein
MLKKIGVSFCGLLGVVALTSCSGVQPPPTPYGIEHKVSASSSTRPEWIDNERSYRQAHKDRKYFMGMAQGIDDYAMLREEAKTLALGNLAEQIQAKLNTLENIASTNDSTGVNGTNADIQHAVREAVISQAAATVTGASIDKYYWTKYWIQESPGSDAKYIRKVYALGSMSQVNWDKTVKQTLEGVKQKVNNPDAKALVQKMEDKYFNR